MPVDILTPEQRQRYGRYNGEPTPEQLTRYGYLSQGDKDLIRRRRPEAYQQLGLAIQLITVRFLGTFLDDPLDLPERVIAFGAEQLGFNDWPDLARYLSNRDTRFDHRRIICQVEGYKDFTDSLAQWSLLRWLYARSWYSVEQPIALFDLATAWLVEHKVLLPGVTVLERLVARVSDQAAERLWTKLANRLNPEQTTRLLGLLEPAPDSPFTHLELLRRAPVRQSGPGLLAALKRLTQFRALAVNGIDLSLLPPIRLKMMAQYAASVKTFTIERQSVNRRLATLLAFARAYETQALDDALDLLEVLLSQTFAQAVRTGDQNRLQTLKDLDAAALRLAEVSQIILDLQIADHLVRSEALKCVKQDALQRAVDTVRALARPAGDQHQQEMVERYRQIKIYLPTVLQIIDFQATTGGQPVKASLDFVGRTAGQSRADFSQAPLTGLHPAWRRAVVGRAGQIDRKAYTVWTTYRLREALRRHDLYVPGSERWGDVQGNLLHGESWEKVKAEVCRALDRSLSGGVELERLCQQLDEAYRTTLAHLPENLSVEIRPGEGLSLGPLEAQPEPESLQQLRPSVEALLPWIDLSEVLLEVEARTQFAQDFVPLSESAARDPQLNLSLCAALLVSACNLTYAPVVQDDQAALTLERLAYVRQHFLRPETIALANARLVQAQGHIDLVRFWGSGEVASADGLRFVVPVQAANALPNKKYFGSKRGVTYFNFTSDQFSGFHGIVVPGTLRDSLFTLEGLLEQETSLQPSELMTDTASYSDIVFALFWLLGYIFSPRLAALGETRFWRIDSRADYGELNPLARHTIKTELILQHLGRHSARGRFVETGCGTRDTGDRSSSLTGCRCCRAAAALRRWPGRSRSWGASSRRSICSNTSTTSPTAVASRSSSIGVKAATRWHAGSFMASVGSCGSAIAKGRRISWGRWVLSPTQLSCGTACIWTQP